MSEMTTPMIRSPEPETPEDYSDRIDAAILDDPDDALATACDSEDFRRWLALTVSMALLGRNPRYASLIPERVRQLGRDAIELTNVRRKEVSLDYFHGERDRLAQRHVDLTPMERELRGLSPEPDEELAAALRALRPPKGPAL